MNYAYFGGREMKVIKILAVCMTVLVVGAVAADPAAADYNKNFKFSKGNVWQK